MLNRTNLTQTALLNGLNLGTRSLVLGTSLNTNGKALIVRDRHHGFMRDGMGWHVVNPVISWIYEVPPIPSPYSEVKSPRSQSVRPTSKRQSALGSKMLKPRSVVADRARDCSVDAARRARIAAAAAAGA